MRISALKSASLWIGLTSLLISGHDVLLYNIIHDTRTPLNPWILRVMSVWMYQLNEYTSEYICSYCCDFLDTFRTNWGFTCLLGVDAGFLHQPGYHHQQLVLCHLPNTVEQSCKLECMARTFVERVHNPGRSIEQVNTEFPQDASRGHTKTSTFLLTLRFECALTIFLTVARG